MAKKEKIKIVSFNLRYDNPDDGFQNVRNRLPFIADTIRREAPSVIGFQEIQTHIAPLLRDLLPEYYILGHGREIDFTGEMTAIAIDRSVFDIIQMDSFWLSKTPSVPGSRYVHQSGCPRTCTMVTLVRRSDGFRFRVYNTHLDHEYGSARAYGINQIIRRIASDYRVDGFPFLLTGDFNALPYSPELRRLNASPLFHDLTDELLGTFHDFGTLEKPQKIDYIYGSPEIKISSRGIWNCTRDGLFLSDHYPVYVVI